MEKLFQNSGAQTIENKCNTLIGGKVVEVLKDRLLLNQDILRIEKIEDGVTLDEYVRKINELKEKLALIEKGSADYKALEEEFYGFKDNYSKKVVLNELEISQLFTYINASLTRLGIPEFGEKCTSHDLVKNILIALGEFISECYGSEDKELTKWIDFICSSRNALFSAKTNERYSLKGTGRDYFTISDAEKTIFAISDDGNVSVNESVDRSNKLLLNNLYLGTINQNGKRLITLLSVKQGGLYPVFFDYNCDTYIEEYDKRIELDAQIITSFSLALKYRGLSQLIEPLYDKKMLEYVIFNMNDRQFLSFDFTAPFKNIDVDAGKISERELSVYVSNADGSYKFGIARHGNDKNVNTETFHIIANLNEILELIGLDYLIAESYDSKELEYITLCMKEQKAPLISISEETPNITLKN